MNQITSVLTVVERPEYLNTQIDCIKKQSINSDIFIVWRNKQQYDLKYPAILYFNESSHFNSLYGRFYNSLHIKTPYVFICDDDLLPGKKYLERCIEFSKSKNDKVVISSYGMKFKEGEKKYNVNKRINHNTFPKVPVKVDMGGQGWFMKTELLKLFTSYPYLLDDSGEDIHFSFCLFKNSIDIFVLDKDIDNKDTWQDTCRGSRGNDEKAQWKNTTHKIVRDKLIDKYTSLGWKFNINKSFL